jgi:hypothetical protein
VRALAAEAWKKRKDSELLDGAMRCGEWLQHQLTRDNLGCHCPVRPDRKGFGDRPYSGFAHGIAGVAFFFSLLYEATTRESRWLDRALEFGNKIIGYRDVLSEGDAWPTDAPGVYSADFLYGAAGIGHFLLRLETQGELPMPLIGRNFPSDHPND